jgi:hypothetical protein
MVQNSLSIGILYLHFAPKHKDPGSIPQVIVHLVEPLSVHFILCWSLLSLDFDSRSMIALASSLVMLLSRLD